MRCDEEVPRVRPLSFMVLIMPRTFVHIPTTIRLGFNKMTFTKEIWRQVVP